MPAVNRAEAATAPHLGSAHVCRQMTTVTAHEEDLVEVLDTRAPKWDKPLHLCAVWRALAGVGALGPEPAL
jgi:hypothetical protein